jgi:hypothetical protein
MTGECLRLLNTRIFANLPSEFCSISLVQFWNCFCSFGFIDLVEYVV